METALWLTLFSVCCNELLAAFVTPGGYSRTSTTQVSATAQKMNNLDVVLFGIGDLRTDDHLGLLGAVQSSNNAILPIALLNDQAIKNLPGAVAHTADTAQLLEAALTELHSSLESTTGLALHSITGSISLEDALNRIKIEADVDHLRVHVCDLGIVDNELGYGAISQLTENLEVEVIKWNQNLRQKPWKVVECLPDMYTEYEAKFARRDPAKPQSAFQTSLPHNRVANVEKFRSIPTSQDILTRFIGIYSLDADRCQAEVGTGLYATHWGGLPPSSVGCQSVLKTIDYYVTDCKENDVTWSHHPAYLCRFCERNGLSLEHAAMTWQLQGDRNVPGGHAEHWHVGESMVRYLAAPLLLGTISPRRVWHASMNNIMFFTSPLKRMVESREWHKLLAAHRIAADLSNGSAEKTKYKYWRYHGFLYRYVERDFERKSTADGKEGILLLHGFGASGAQWNNAMSALSNCETTAVEGLAPDLLGFGEAEKPALSFTSYLWTSMIMDFCREVAIKKNKWTSFVVGGNSIGGYTGMSLAACDRAMVGSKMATSSGAPGTGKCTGVIVMNSAGPTQTREQRKWQAHSKKKPILIDSVAEATAMNALPVRTPLSRPAVQAFCAILLHYLRPRIQAVCRKLYPTNPEAVDEALCTTILRDSLDPGAIYVMMAVAKHPPSRPANELLSRDAGSASVASHHSVDRCIGSFFDGEVLVAHGVLDPLFDARDCMNRFRNLRRGITVAPIQAGHCPHHEQPHEVAKSIASWLQSTKYIRRVYVKSKIAHQQYAKRSLFAIYVKRGLKHVSLRRTRVKSTISRPQGSRGSQPSSDQVDDRRGPALRTRHVRQVAHPLGSPSH